MDSIHTLGISRTHPLNIPLYAAGIDSICTLRDPLIVLDPVHHHPMRFSGNISVFKAIFFFQPMEIVDDSVADDRRAPVVIDDGRFVDIVDAHIVIVSGAIKMIAIDNDGPVRITVSVDIDGHPFDVAVANDRRMPSPMAVSIVDFPGCQGEPAHMTIPVNPGDSSRIPGKTDADRRGDIHSHARHGRSPIPIVIHINPVAVVVCHVSERLIGDPAIVPMVDNPSPFAERSPSGTHPCRPPELMIIPVVVDFLPTPIIIQLISFVMQSFGQIAYGFSPHLRSLSP
jgi:hypothetical protein